MNIKKDGLPLSRASVSFLIQWIIIQLYVKERIGLH